MFDIFQPQEVKTRQEIAIEQARILSMENKQTLDILKLRLEKSFDCLWANNEATPQEILDIYGQNAYKLFEVAGATIQFILSLDPNYIPPKPPEGYIVTIKENGSVTAQKNQE